MFSFFAAKSLCSDVEGIFKRVYNDKIILIDVSGSSKQYINGSRQLTKPEYAIEPFDKSYDWCSNCGRTYDEHPWISFSLKSRKMRISGYYIKSGCCQDDLCCCDDDVYGCFDCCLYSWSLQISDDNKTWKEVHRIEKDYDMRKCKDSTYKFDQSYVSKYVRLIQTEACPGWPPCIAINKMELLGDIISEEGVDDFVSFHDDDDDVSIIGHISKSGNIKI